MHDEETGDYAWTEEELSGCLRFDRASTLPGATRTKEGYLRIFARVAKVGVLRYPHGNEYVPASALADPEFLSELEHKPIFIEHPTGNDGKTILVTSKNIANFDRVGTVLSPVTFDGEYVIAPLQIEKAYAIDLIVKGLREVSPGYLVPPADMVNQEGVYNGQPFQRIQSKRRMANHIVFTKKGRGGSDIAASIRGDSAADIQIQEAEPMNPLFVQLLTAAGLDPAAYADDASAAAALQTQITGVSAGQAAARAELEALKTQLPAMAADLEAGRLRVQELTEQLEEVEEDGEVIVDSALKAGPTPKPEDMKGKKGQSLPPDKAKKKADNLAKTFKKITATAATMAKMDAAAAALKIPGADKMSLPEKTKAVAMRTDSTISDNESPDYYRAIAERGPNVVQKTPGRTLGSTLTDPTRTDSATVRPHFRPERFARKPVTASVSDRE